MGADSDYTFFRLCRCVRKKMSQEAKPEAEHLSTIEEKTLAALSEAEAANNLSNALKQTTSGITDFTQQTLIDVNSQPLIHNLMEDQHLLGHPSLNTASSQPFLSANNHILSAAIHKNQATSESVSNAMDTTTNTNEHKSNENGSTLLTEFYERFAQGKMFQTLEELRTAAYDYGRRHNVALTTSKSDKTKVYLICKHGGQYRKNNKRPPSDKPIKPRIRRSQKTGCACMIYARCCRGSFWIVRKSIGEHNHPIADDPRTYAMYRSLSPEHLLAVHKLLREHVGVSYIVKSLKANGVTNILPKDIENIQQDLKRRDVLDMPVAVTTTTTTTAATAAAAAATTTTTTTNTTTAKADEGRMASSVIDLTDTMATNAVVMSTTPAITYTPTIAPSTIIMEPRGSSAIATTNSASPAAMMTSDLTTSIVTPSPIE
jgi:hypothetical protein